MRKQTGRKAFILLSDGGDVNSKVSIGTAIEYAQRADTIIYSIVFANHIRVAHPAVVAGQEIYLFMGRRAMHRLAHETGGEYFVVSRADPIESIYTRIEDDLRNQYSIGFISDQNDAGDRYRKLTLSVKKPRLLVHTRDGYYSPVQK